MSDHDRQPGASETVQSPVADSAEHAAPRPAMLGEAGARLGGGLLQRKLQRRALQRREASGEQAGGPVDMHAAAAEGTSGAGGSLPHLDVIQRSFGRHDVSHVRAFTDDGASHSARAMGAEAYATGDRVAFAGAPSLHTAAHEAAHVVQQRAGVHLAGGVGQVGDRYEQHADAAADAVVRGASAEAILDAEAPGGGGGAAPAIGDNVQHKIGYEFETNARVRSKEGKQYKMLSKGDSLSKKRGLDAQVDTNPKDGSRIEFVSDAFDASREGREATRESLDKLVEWTDKINNLKSSAGKMAQNTPHYRPLSRAMAEADRSMVVDVNFVTAQLEGNPQVSAGMDLHELKGVLDAWAPEKGTQRTGKDVVVPKMFTGVVNPEYHKRLLAALRKTTFGDIGVVQGGENEQAVKTTDHLSDALQSLIWLMASYLKTIDGAGNNPFKNSKEITVLLSRNNFATLFGTLPAAERKALQNNPLALVSAIGTAGSINMQTPVYPHGFLKGSANNQQVIQFDLTRIEWVVAITRGSDKLTQQHWDDVSPVDRKDGITLPGQHLHKSLGGYGDRQDQDRGYQQAVFEFRKVDQKQTPRGFRTQMMNIWDFLIAKMDEPEEEKK